MAATTIRVTNLTRGSLSLSGDKGIPGIIIKSKSMNNAIPYVDVDLSYVFGNQALCSDLSDLLTAGKVTITRGSLSVTTSDLTSYSHGSDMSRSDYDANDDKNNF
jgi:hypothetical protein